MFYNTPQLTNQNELMAQEWGKVFERVLRLDKIMRIRIFKEKASSLTYLTTDQNLQWIDTYINAFLTIV